MRSYNPTMAGLVAATQDDWGDPEENLARTIYYRINHIDQALVGIDMGAGEMIGIQATEKQRKSTMLLNLIVAFASQLRQHGYWLCADTLESGMPPSAYRDSLIAIIATRVLVSKFYGNDTSKWPDVSVIRGHPELGPQMNMSRTFFKYGRRTKMQHDVIEVAKRAASALPLSIFGPAMHMGKTRDVEAAIKRWDALYRGEYVVPPSTLNPDGIDLTGKEHRIFTCDHISQIGKYGGDHYSRQEEVVQAHAEFVVTHPGSVVIDVAQIGSSSSMNEKRGFGRAHAKGGLALAAEVTVLFRTKYDDDADPDRMEIHVQETRHKKPPPVIQDIDLESGAFLRAATLKPKGYNHANG